MLIADEAWLLIDNNCPQSLAFLRNAEKRARKYEGSIVVSTQNIIDFLDPSVKKFGQEILDSPSIKMIFGADGKTLQEVKNVFNLNQSQTELVESKQRGVALMKVGAQPVKIKIELSESRLNSFGSGGGR
jgi:type IV secretory pathway VirB4 component